MGIGVVLAAIFMGYPLYQAHSGAPEVTIYPKMTMASLACFAIGIVVLLGIRFVEDQNNVKFRDIVIALVVGGVTAAVYFFYKAHIEGLGYRFPEL